jgi:arylsulfatase A-like enzyme
MTAGVIAASLGCGRRPEPPPRTTQAILITVDTLRADVVGAARAGVPITPELDRFGRDAVRFTDCLANCTATGPSHACMLTGLYPGRNGVMINGGRFREGVKPLAQRLEQRGFATAAVVSSTPLTGLEAGFASWVRAFNAFEQNRTDQPYATPDKTTREALEWLKHHRDLSFFMMIHYFPPHGPYVAPEQFRIAQLEAPSGRRLRVSTLDYEWRRIPAYQRLGDLHDVGMYTARYLANVRYADHYVGTLLQGLRELGLYDQAAIIVTADHGESLGEHGWYFCHANLVYREQSAVPLLLKLPSRRYAGRIVGAPVEGVDIFPTLLELLGQPVPRLCDGRSLLGVIATPARDTRTRYTQSNGAELAAVISNPWKFSLRNKPSAVPSEIAPSHPERELFRLDVDPREEVNLFVRQEKVATQLERALRALLPASIPPSPIDQETLQRLRSLGYVQ